MQYDVYYHALLRKFCVAVLLVVMMTISTISVLYSQQQ